VNQNPVDMSAPAYQRGQDWANETLDKSWLPAQDILALADRAADIAHERGDTTAYLVSRGFGDTIRDYLTERST
jgi:hypothetical protein